MVEDLEGVPANVEKLDGRAILPKTEIPSVDLDAIIQDMEGNTIGFWQPERRWIGRNCLRTGETCPVPAPDQAPLTAV